MSYTELTLAGVVVAILVDCLLLRTTLVLRQAFWAAYVIVLLCQLLVNGVLAGVPVVRYNADAILGARFVYAPVEDLLFGFAMVLITLSTWVFLGRVRIGDVPARRQSDHVSQ